MATKKTATKKTDQAPSSMTVKDKQAEITKELNALQKATNSGDKKRIRRKLRALGHTGGLQAIKKNK